MTKINREVGSPEPVVKLDLSRDYTVNIPSWIVRYRGIPMGAKIVYGTLYRYAGKNCLSFPKMPELAKEVGVSERQVRDYVKELRDAKFLRSWRGLGTSYTFEFLDHPARSGDIGTPRFQPPTRAQFAARYRNA